MKTIPVLNGEHLSNASRESVLSSACSSADDFNDGDDCFSCAPGESFDLKFNPANGAIGFTFGRPYGLGKCPKVNCCALAARSCSVVKF